MILDNLLLVNLVVDSNVCSSFTDKSLLSLDVPDLVFRDFILLNLRVSYCHPFVTCGRYTSECSTAEVKFLLERTVMGCTTFGTMS